jgi:hypothetical protein
MVVTGNLAIAGTTNAWTGALDLAGNDLDIQNGNLATLTNQIAEGFSDGWQTKGGIISSAAAADTTHLTTLGIIQNTTPDNPAQPLFTSFDTQPVAATDVLIKYTTFGDANLDGIVDGSDYSLIDNGIATKLTGWANGDFNYDRVVNGADYTLMDNAYLSQSATPAAQIAASPMAAVGAARTIPQPFPVPAIPAASSMQPRLNSQKLTALNEAQRSNESKNDGSTTIPNALAFALRHVTPPRQNHRFSLKNEVFSSDVAKGYTFDSDSCEV